MTVIIRVVLIRCETEILAIVSLLKNPALQFLLLEICCNTFSIGKIEIVLEIEK